MACPAASPVRMPQRSIQVRPAVAYSAAAATPRMDEDGGLRRWAIARAHDSAAAAAAASRTSGPPKVTPNARAASSGDGFGASGAGGEAAGGVAVADVIAISIGDHRAV